MRTANLDLDYLRSHAEQYMEAMEEIQEGMTAGQQMAYIAAMLDGKRFTIRSQFVSDESKFQAGMYKEQDRLLLLAANWDAFK